MVSFTVRGKAAECAIIIVVSNALENAIGEKKVEDILTTTQYIILGADQFND